VRVGGTRVLESWGGDRIILTSKEASDARCTGVRKDKCGDIKKPIMNSVSMSMENKCIGA